MTECNHIWVYTKFSHERKCALCGKEEILIFEPTDESCMRYIPRWIEKPKPQIDLSQFRIYYDGVIKYDARYPLKEHWINQIVKKWWKRK
jgi:hypothetical protein